MARSSARLDARRAARRGLAGLVDAELVDAELARRIRSFRAVSVANDPQRGYRAKMNRCRKGLASYHRLAGIPKVPKDRAD